MHHHLRSALGSYTDVNRIYKRLSELIQAPGYGKAYIPKLMSQNDRINLIIDKTRVVYFNNINIQSQKISVIIAKYNAGAMVLNNQNVQNLNNYIVIPLDVCTAGDRQSEFFL